MIFSPSRLAPFVPFLTTAGTLFIPFDLILGWHHLGEHLNVTGLISASGVTVAAWVRLFQRQEVWSGLQELIEQKWPDAKKPTWIRREVAYVYDYFHITRALRERKMDRTIEAAEIGFSVGSERVEAITRSQKIKRKENFAKESFPKLRR